MIIHHNCSAAYHIELHQPGIVIVLVKGIENTLAVFLGTISHYIFIILRKLLLCVHQKLFDDAFVNVLVKLVHKSIAYLYHALFNSQLFGAAAVGDDLHNVHRSVSDVGYHNMLDYFGEIATDDEVVQKKVYEWACAVYDEYLKLYN